jgi:hypothetical protein
MFVARLSSRDASSALRERAAAASELRRAIDRVFDLLPGPVLVEQQGHTLHRDVPRAHEVLEPCGRVVTGVRDRGHVGVMLQSDDDRCILAAAAHAPGRLGEVGPAHGAPARLRMLGRTRRSQEAAAFPASALGAPVGVDCRAVAEATSVAPLPHVAATVGVEQGALTVRLPGAEAARVAAAVRPAEGPEAVHAAPGHAGVAAPAHVLARRGRRWARWRMGSAGRARRGAGPSVRGVEQLPVGAVEAVSALLIALPRILVPAILASDDLVVRGSPRRLRAGAAARRGLRVDRPRGSRGPHRARALALELGDPQDAGLRVALGGRVRREQEADRDEERTRRDAGRAVRAVAQVDSLPPAGGSLLRAGIAPQSEHPAPASAFAALRLMVPVTCVAYGRAPAPGPRGRAFHVKPGSARLSGCWNRRRGSNDAGARPIREPHGASAVGMGPGWARCGRGGGGI